MVDEPLEFSGAAVDGRRAAHAGSTGRARSGRLERSLRDHAEVQ
jgi:hypothetical protein